MKVIAISGDSRNLEDLRKLATGLELVVELYCHQGDLAGMAMLPVRDEMDVLILDCRHGGSAPIAVESPVIRIGRSLRRPASSAASRREIPS